MQQFRFLITLLVWTCIVCYAFPARATLDEVFVPDSTKQVKRIGAIRIKTLAQYTVNEYTLESGTVVREFVSADQKVFAVAWKGQLKPDLRQLLGTHFDRYVNTASNKRRSGRHPVLLHDADLVIHATGHMRAFSGIVYLPTEIPAGVTENELQ